MLLCVHHEVAQLAALLNDGARPDLPAPSQSPESAVAQLESTSARSQDLVAVLETVVAHISARAVARRQARKRLSSDHMPVPYRPEDVLIPPRGGAGQTASLDLRTSQGEWTRRNSDIFSTGVPPPHPGSHVSDRQGSVGGSGVTAATADPTGTFVPGASSTVFNAPTRAALGEPLSGGFPTATHDQAPEEHATIAAEDALYFECRLIAGAWVECRVLML